ncbi:hypothetical protein AVEN_56410-1 [Araneus ventricosus]|uniref:Uncharacterized protein n=1 Tax=Araneus ventricosus TaxID=182803 RepID=A0A4Y2GLP9_ARAVE|nr:hypothetical protein AVEN_56410-1 [Araneus ventricosus]
MVRSRLRGRRVPGSIPDSTEDRRAWGLLHDEPYAVGKHPPVGVVYNTHSALAHPIGWKAGSPSAVNKRVGDTESSRDLRMDLDEKPHLYKMLFLPMDSTGISPLER